MDAIPPTARPKRGLFFWALSPVLILFVTAMPFLIQKHDVVAISTLVGMEITGVLMLLGLFDPYRFAWAWRGVGAIVFLGTVAYVVATVVEGKWQPPRHRGESNLINAVAALLSFGLPGLWWALVGQTPHAFASLDPSQCKNDNFEQLDEPEAGLDRDSY